MGCQKKSCSKSPKLSTVNGVKNNMKEEVYSIALKNALNEVRNICPDVTCCFLFDKNGTVIAGDEETDGKKVRKAAQSFDGVLEKAKSLGGLQAVAIDGTKGKVHISCVDDMYFAMVTPKKADMTYLRTVARVIIPTVIKLANSITSTSFQSVSPQPKQKLKKEKEEELEETLAAPSNQLIVKTIGGLLVRTDRVEIDKKILTEWSENCNDGEEINEVEIESFGGETTKCKVKEIGDSKLEDKGIVRMPEKIQKNLDVKEGELVRVKPALT